MRTLAIDPGDKGAITLIDGEELSFWAMPITVHGKEKELDFERLIDLLTTTMRPNRLDHIFLERAVSFGMGTKGAFNYGRSFGKIEIAIRQTLMPVTYIEPGKWAKEMHAGISGDLKAKAKSLLAAERLYPHWFTGIPSVKGKKHDGVIDSLLINGYGRRLLGKTLP